MNSTTRVVDAHQHVFWHGQGDCGLVRDMDEQGIEYAWLLTWEIAPWDHIPGIERSLNPLNVRADGTHAGIVLRDLLLARDRYPDRFVVGYCPHPMIGDAPGLLRATAAIHDVRVCGEWKFRLPFDDPRCLELYRAAEELDLPVVLHLDVPWLMGEGGKRVYQSFWYGGTVDNLERALQACPGTTFIGHAPGFWREISADADRSPLQYPEGEVKKGGRIYELLDRYPNLHADLSAGSACGALKRDLTHARRFLTRYQDRLLFARDYYGGELRQLLESLTLPREILEKLCHINAEKLVSPPFGAVGMPRAPERVRGHLSKRSTP